MNKNRTLKIIGTIVTVIALFFIIKKLVELNLDYSLLLQKTNLLYIILFSAVYGIQMFVICIPWKTFISILTHEKIPFSKATWIYNKSNFMKYIPGNVFQYVGRNELAIRLNLSHVDVSFATVCDIIMIVAANFLVSVIMYAQGVGKWFAKYGVTSFYFVLIVLAVICIVLAILFVKRKQRVKNYLDKLHVFVEKQSVIRLLCCFLYYLFLTLVISLSFTLVLQKIVGTPVKPEVIPIIIGTYTLSWIAGFIVPGAPGGIGIREAVITLLLTGVVPVSDALMAALIFRFINIIGDFWGLFLAFIFNKSVDRYHRKEEITP
ncbi:MAG: lysylphosphatidylglycerol synthase domain-containing protein [Clostridia bacterium]|nr:lysylphosphatidylglycerol synthase domain-containing protein [Clostridia bacterium]